QERVNRHPIGASRAHLGCRVTAIRNVLSLGWTRGSARGMAYPLVASLDSRIRSNPQPGQGHDKLVLTDSLHSRARTVNRIFCPKTAFPPKFFHLSAPPASPCLRRCCYVNCYMRALLSTYLRPELKLG